MTNSISTTHIPSKCLARLRTGIYVAFLGGFLSLVLIAGMTSLKRQAPLAASPAPRAVDRLRFASLDDDVLTIFLVRDAGQREAVLADQEKERDALGGSSSGIRVEVLVSGTPELEKVANNTVNEAMLSTATVTVIDVRDR